MGVAVRTKQEGNRGVVGLNAVFLHFFVKFVALAWMAVTNVLHFTE